jgi:multidrug efflux pump subunit AcrA (membrane-fusion protein)
VRRRRLVWLAVIAALGVAGWYSARGLWDSTTELMAEAGPFVPTTRLSRGSIVLSVHMQGDLRAARQMALTAPSVGGNLRILTVVDNGSAVAKDDVIMEFDPADQQYALEQAESELQEAEQEILKRRADVQAQEAADKVALLTAQFDVRRAELDAAVDADLITANEHKIRQVELDESKRRLQKIEQDVMHRAVTSKASIAVLEERRTKARLSAERARQNMDTLVVRAPIDGFVSIRENQDASGGFFFSGMTLPAYRAGDTVFSGRPIADVFEIKTMEIRARVNEQERANVSPGQPAQVECDALPGVVLDARVTAVSGLGRPVLRTGPLRQFEVTLELPEPDPRMRPGTSVRVQVQGQKLENVLLLPRQALFDKDGKLIVYVRAASGDFAPREVKVLHRTEGQVVIEGLDESSEVALIHPDAAKQSGTTPAPAPAAPRAAPGVAR